MTLYVCFLKKKKIIWVYQTLMFPVKVLASNISKQLQFNKTEDETNPADRLYIIWCLNILIIIFVEILQSNIKPFRRRTFVSKLSNINWNVTRLSVFFVITRCREWDWGLLDLELIFSLIFKFKWMPIENILLFCQLVHD